MIQTSPTSPTDDLTYSTTFTGTDVGTAGDYNMGVIYIRTQYGWQPLHTYHSACAMATYIEDFLADERSCLDEVELNFYAQWGELRQPKIIRGHLCYSKPFRIDRLIIRHLRRRMMAKLRGKNARS